MASTSSSEKDTITLVTSDNQAFEVSVATACMSVTVKNLMEEDCASGSGSIPLPNVDSATMPKVIEYCKRHVGYVADADADADAKQTLEKFDEEFAKEVQKEQNMLFDLILAANYLNIDGLLNLLCQTVANMMKGKTPEQIRAIFHIVNDYSEAEEAAVRKENSWAFE